MAASRESMDIDDVKDDNSECQPIIPGYADINEYSQKVLKSVLQATRSSNSLPTGDDYDFYSTFRSVKDVLDIEGRRILQLIESILRQQSVKAKISTNSDVIEFEDKFDAVMDANDQILERVGSSLDEASGIKKPEADLVFATATARTSTAASWNKKEKSTAGDNTYRLLAARNIERPQLKFKVKIDNSNRPFIPQIKHKPNAQQSLADSLRLPEKITPLDMESPTFVYPHPYQYELDHLQYNPQHLMETEVQEPRPIDSTPLTLIDTESELKELCDHLKTVPALAIDLEAHTYRSFQGLTCLMQVSTREQDYIIDTLELRHNMHILNEVFTDPNTVKVFHGAQSDIEWLQRDFNLYVVNMFDTGEAARTLEHSRASLAHLLNVYCQVTTDKKYQLADWRIRPLPELMVKYARTDTHYLLYIYDKMKNELLQKGNEQKNLLHHVLSKSVHICARVYRKPVFEESQYLDLYRKSKKLFNSQQHQALRDLYAWRNKIARQEEESPWYVFPNHMLLQSAQVLPREQQGVLACCRPIPPLVRQNLSEIHSIIMEARSVSLVKVDRPKVQFPSAAQHPKYDSESLLNCPHDTSHINKAVAMVTDDETQPDSSLISTTSSVFRDGSDKIPLQDNPIISAFSWTRKRTNSFMSTVQKKAEEIKGMFLSPFQMYLQPDEKSTKTKELSQTQPSIQNVSPWKLKPNTVTEKGVKPPTEHTSDTEIDPVTGQPVHIYEPPAKRVKVDTIPISTNEFVLREQAQKKKKKKKKDPLYEASLPGAMDEGVVEEPSLGEEVGEEPEEEEEGEEEEVPKKKGRKTKEFVPHDYSGSYSKIFQGTSKAKDEFNPAGKFKKGKKNKNQKRNSSRGNKSFTYNRGGPQGRGHKKH
ncbi:exosome complex component 10-like [Haliotis cracherodii]|uniref:exosome complex component 10-like n=1 Tax=Haliotis cracherodii TaxID=6455 RepID=UPI0039EAC974